jgi:hypothetical protein
VQTSFEDGTNKLVEWAKREASLSLPEGKITVRKHLEAVRKQKQKEGRSQQQLDEMFPELVEVNVPPTLMHLRILFMDLNLTRPEGFNGPLPITFQEILAYLTLTQQSVTPQEVEILKRMDFVFLTEIRKYIDKQSASKG